MTRIILSISVAFAEVLLCKAISERFGGRVAIFTALGLLVSPGMLFAAPGTCYGQAARGAPSHTRLQPHPTPVSAYLPSSFSMGMAMMAFRAYIQDSPAQTVRRHHGCTLKQHQIQTLSHTPLQPTDVLGCNLSVDRLALCGRHLCAHGHPHAAQWESDPRHCVWHPVRCPLPGACCMATECRAGVLNAPTILPPNAAQLASMAVDYHHYRKLVVPVWNIVRYNALGGGGGDGSNLYGTEPWSFYVKNLFLNFNFTFLVALTSAIVCNTMRHPPPSPLTTLPSRHPAGSSCAAGPWTASLQAVRPRVALALGVSHGALLAVVCPHDSKGPQGV